MKPTSHYITVLSAQLEVASPNRRPAIIKNWVQKTHQEGVSRQELLYALSSVIDNFRRDNEIRALLDQAMDDVEASNLR